MKPLTLSLVIALSLTSCSYNPKVLTNDHLFSVGPEQMRQDKDDCIELAKDFDQNSEEWKRVAKRAGKASVAGSAAGAVGGAIAGNVGRGVGIGAASGAVGAIVMELFRLGETDPSEKRFIDYCLEKKGYKVSR